MFCLDCSMPYNENEWIKCPWEYENVVKKTVTLTWKPRFPKRDREKVLLLLQETYPKAKMIEGGVTVPYRQYDTRPIWIFMLWTCWKDLY